GNHLIKGYFNHGFTYPEIVAFLCLAHGIVISLRHVKRIIRRMGLRRRRQMSGIEEVVATVEVSRDLPNMWEGHGNGNNCLIHSLCHLLTSTGRTSW
ncbi:unnamed protein product, partial [Porites evermanni]